MVFNRLDRVSDQAKNICEETIFAVTGETKEPKVYRVLFVDEKNDGYSQMAEAFARKAFPDSGRYASAGWKPAKSVDPACARFLGAPRPRRRRAEAHSPGSRRCDELADYHVIVSLQSGEPAQLPGSRSTPCCSTGTSDRRPRDWTRSARRALFEQAHKEISTRVRDLMETLRGEEAA